MTLEELYRANANWNSSTKLTLHKHIRDKHVGVTVAPIRSISVSLLTCEVTSFFGDHVLIRLPDMSSES